MAVLPVYGGPKKRDIIQIAAEQCGQAGYEFETSAEEMDSWLRRLNALMAMLASVYGVNLSYNFPDPGARGSGDDDSGIPYEAEQFVAELLADQIAPGMGKQRSGDMINSAALSHLVSTYQKLPAIGMARGTPMGSGNRYLSDFFRVEIPADEP